MKKRQYNNRKVFRLCRQTLMKGQWSDIQITNTNFKAKIQDLNVWKRGWGDRDGFEPSSKFLFFFFFFKLPQSDGILRLSVCECFIS